MILLPFVFLVLLYSLWGGLNRLGVFSDFIFSEAVLYHGLFMVSGFFGALISFERVKGLQVRWGLIIPVIKLLGVFSLVFFKSGTALWLFILSDFLFLVLTGWGMLRFKAYYEGFYLFGAVLCLLCADLGVVFYSLNERIIILWFGFILWTIAGERLELSRFSGKSIYAYIFLLLIFIAFVCGVVFSLPLLIGGTFLSVSLWFLKYDIVFKTVFFKGLPRFTALSLIFGYFWLSLVGVYLLYDGGLFLSHHDSIVHMFFLGFTMSMVMGHAPIIFPALTGFIIPFNTVLYVPLVFFHLSVALRVLGSGILKSQTLFHMNVLNIAAFLNSIGIILFFLTLLVLIIYEKNTLKHR